LIFIVLQLFDNQLITMMIRAILFFVAGFYGRIKQN